MFENARKAIMESSQESSIYVGSDSVRFKKKGRWYAKYSTCIVLHIDSKKGCKIFTRSVDMEDYGNIKQRLLTEVQFVVEAATEILDVIGDRHLEIHIDVNPNPRHKSHVAVKEAISYARSVTDNVKIKPHAFAASYAADHMVRK